MFLNELTPIFEEFTQQPVAFLGGFFSGVFRLNLSDDPLKSWLEAQNGSEIYKDGHNRSENDKNKGPQSISID
ncbi:MULTISPECIES: hypothetical protein [Moorena]|uniref:Uncharacterized protein n=1 Tax=Moorena producens PAL-8-15-08-1 TaxID=1458985 RepID=A0A1D8TXU7_9CYAN|nr:MULTISPECIES: hypothetical protein [Moorena]AOX02480.1 hypothetical protein BJP34_26275 [Moorena producens PAL-8-15-08-1]NEO11685.1 hypothetical protein [Moorena sp. SIO3E8]NEP98300.1 hypothetical protein [Moorena sp. SIO3F7]